jgi:hypothetical protein
MAKKTKTKEIPGSKIKDITFEKVTIPLETPKIHIPISEVMKSNNLSTLKEELGKILEENEELEWDWKDIIRKQMNSPEWGKAHPLNTIDTLELAIEVKGVLKDGTDMEVSVSKEVADLICDIADNVGWVALQDEVAPYALEFKKYFKALKEEEPRKATEDKSGEGTKSIKEKTDNKPN